MVSVIRGFIIPYPISKDKNSKTYDYVDAYDVTDRSKVICQQLKHYYGEALKYLNTYYEGLKEYLGDKINDEKYRFYDKALLVHDVIVWLMRAPLHYDPIEGVHVSPYKLYLLLRLIPLEVLEEIEGRKIGEENLIEIAEILFEIIKRVESLRKGGGNPVKSLEKILYGIQGIINIVDNVNFRRVAEEALYFIPADTRPGFNTVNLFSHLILTSAIMWAIRYSPNNVDFLEILAALLHDIGKPCNPEKHVQASKEYAEELLRRAPSIFSDEERGQIIGLIEKHHSAGSIIHVADEIAAKERSLEAVEKILIEDPESPLIKILSERKGFVNKEELKDYFKKTGREVWNFWKQFTSEDLRKVTEYYVRRIRRLPRERLFRRGSVKGQLKIAAIDVRGIQGAIRRADDLRILIATSYLIDLYVIAYLPFLIQKKKLVPLSAFIYNAGGVVELILPKNLGINDVVDDAHKIAVNNIGVSIVYAEALFNTNYNAMMDELNRNLDKNKLEDARIEELLQGYMKPCDYCGVEKASDKIYEKFVGDLCKKIREFGDLLHFKEKLGIEEAARYIRIDGMGFKDLYASTPGLSEWIKENLIEYYSGMDPDRKYGKTLNYAMISIDGNLMGLFMSSSTSFSDAIERSFRIDLALKKALRETIEDTVKKTLEKLEKNRGVREALRIYTGILYVGGDDARFIVPAWLSIPFTLSLIALFYRYMGGYSTLSAGIATAPPKHSVWGLLEASSKLEEYAKSVGRKISILTTMCDEVSGLGALGLVYTDSTSMLTDSKIKYLYDELVNKMYLSVQPFSIANNRPEDIVRILEKIASNNPVSRQFPPNKPDELVVQVLGLTRNLLEESYTAIYGGKRSSVLKEWIKIVREVIERYNSSLNESKGSVEYASAKTLIYARRQSARLQNSPKSKVYGSIAELGLLNNNNRIIVLPLHDLYTIIKTLGGGAL